VLQLELEGARLDLLIEHDRRSTGLRSTGMYRGIVHLVGLRARSTLKESSRRQQLPVCQAIELLHSLNVGAGRPA
jgi:hypothetical protein